MTTEIKRYDLNCLSEDENCPCCMAEHATGLYLLAADIDADALEEAIGSLESDTAGTYAIRWLGATEKAAIKAVNDKHITHLSALLRAVKGERE